MIEKCSYTAGDKFFIEKIHERQFSIQVLLVFFVLTQLVVNIVFLIILLGGVK